jgi:cysteinyl-tRNA synthetase
MGLRLFNTLTRTVVPFTPRDPAGWVVGMYVCGPTVYDHGHVGNFRTFVFADLVRRYLEFLGHRVMHVMNITDVEDKIIRRVRETGLPLREYTGRYEAGFFEDARRLNLLPPHHQPRATEFIPDIIALIERLMARGVAYRAADGSVYFSIARYQAEGRRYGVLKTLDFETMRPGERVAADECDKESVADFALWKARVPDDGVVFWPSPWGEGRPGWHIECSAMSMKLLGPSFDLHLGGEDLVFPHHEDEIAQSEGAALQPAGQPFVRHWLHGAHLLVEGRKMAKSAGNFFTVRDLLARGATGREIRYLLLTAHYRESFSFTLEGLTGARAALARLSECAGRLRQAAGTAKAGPEPGLIERFTEALNDDLNISAAWAAVFEWVRNVNKLLAEGGLTPDQAAAAVAAWERVDSVLGVGEAANAEPPPEVVSLAQARHAARQARDFAQADRLRAELKERGWQVEDTPSGPKLKPL